MPKLKKIKEKDLKRKIFRIILIIFLVFFFVAVLSSLRSNRVNQESSVQSIGYSSGGALVGNVAEDNLKTEESFVSDRAFTEEPLIADSGESVLVSEDISFEKKVIKNGSLALKVESVDEASKEISEIVRNQGGEVFSTNFYERVKDQKSGFVNIKVPVSKFEETMEKLKEVATQVLSESMTGQDVTEQYEDLQIQLRNKKAEEESFVKILDRAGKIDDVLAATKQIARVRSEIERLEGRIRFMESQTDMSTIVINLTEDIEVSSVNDEWRIGQVFKEALNELKWTFQSFVNGLIRFVIVGIPTFAPFALLVWFLYWIGKKFLKNE